MHAKEAKKILQHSNNSRATYSLIDESVNDKNLDLLSLSTTILIDLCYQCSIYTTNIVVIYTSMILDYHPHKFINFFVSQLGFY